MYCQYVSDSLRLVRDVFQEGGGVGGGQICKQTRTRGVRVMKRKVPEKTGMFLLL